MVEAAGELVLVQEDDLAGGRGLLREALLLFLRAVDPNDMLRLAQTSGLLDPLLQFPMLVHERSPF
jgi:hypothetical protein